MESTKKYLPSLAFSLFLMLTQGTGVSAIASTKIDDLSHVNIDKQVDLRDGNILNSVPEEAETELLSNLAVVPVKPDSNSINSSNSNNSVNELRLFERAIKIAQEMPFDNSKISTLSDIAVKLAKAGQKQRSLEIFDQVISLTQKTTKDFNEYQQEESLRNISIKLAQAGFIDKALDLGKKLSSNLIKAQVFNEVSLILTENGKRPQAQQILEQALQYARLISGNYYYESNGSCANYKHEILSKIAANLSLQAQLNKALSIAQTISGCGSASGESTEEYQAWAFLGILNNLRQLEPIKQTWYASQKIKFSQEKALVWSKIAVKMADMGETSFALSIGKKLAAEIPSPTTINSGYDVGTFFVREKSLAEIGIKLAQKHQFNGAMEIAQTLTEILPEIIKNNFSYYPENKISILSEIGKQMVATKKLPQALQLIKNIPDKTTKTFVQIAIANELQKNGQQTQAMQLFQTLSFPKIPTRASSHEDSQIFHDIVIALVAAKQTEKAMQLINSIEKDFDQESSLTDIAIQLADLGELSSALNLVKNLQNEGSKKSVNDKVTIKLIEQGKLEEALQILTSQSEPDTLLISQIAEKFASVGKREKAIATVETITDKESQAKTLAAIALTLIINK
jgi:tetratricopeptide (TPR) repeat protein